MKKKQYIIPQVTVTTLQTVSLMAQSMSSGNVGITYGGKASEEGINVADTNIDDWEIW